MACDAHAARPHVIALIPVRDEQWTLRRCLATASLWADHIIVADQHSGDGSVAIARGFPKVTLIENRDREFSEVSRSGQLIDTARSVCDAPRVLVSIDADEILSANVLTSTQWEAAIHARAGTHIRYTRVTLGRDASSYFRDVAADLGAYIPFAYADDGFPYDGGLIHTCHVPSPPDAPAVDVPDVAVIHYNHCHPDREAMKDRWYRCFERVHESQRDVVEITRRYDWMQRLSSTFRVRPVPPEWFQAYLDSGIDLRPDDDPGIFWCEEETLRLFAKYGTRRFRFLDLWSVDWESVRLAARARGVTGVGDAPVEIPDGLIERSVRHLLARQPPNRWIDGALRRFCRIVDR